MDQELERALRAAREAPEELAPAIRLAAVTERLGLFRDAWTALVRLSGRTDDEPSLNQALAGLAKRNPAATVGYLAECEDDRARFSCQALGRAGALLPLVVLGSRAIETPLQLDAQIALHQAIAPDFPGLPGVGPLRELVTSSRPDELFAYVRHMSPRFAPYSHEVFTREFGGELPSTRALEEILARAANPAGVSVPRPAPRGIEHWTEVARDVVTRARSERRHALLPWLHSAAAALDRKLASEAVEVFHELTGKLAPPLDPAELARRWV